MGTKHGLLWCRSVRRKPPVEQWSRRETVEARGTKWNFDVEMDSDSDGTDGNSHSTSPAEEHVPEIRGHSISGGGDVAAKMKMVIYDPSYADPAKTNVMGKVVRYTNILEAPIPDLLNEDGKLIDTVQIIIAQKLQECKNDIYVTMVSRGGIVSLPKTGTSLL